MNCVFEFIHIPRILLPWIRKICKLKRQVRIQKINISICLFIYWFILPISMDLILTLEHIYSSTCHCCWGLCDHEKSCFRTPHISLLFLQYIQVPRRLVLQVRSSLFFIFFIFLGLNCPSQASCPCCQHVRTARLRHEWDYFELKQLKISILKGRRSKIHHVSFVGRVVTSL